MIEVHSPHERISGFRDFLLHLLTITIGLLIALGLEGCVEWWHHRNLRNEADTRLRQEITDNQKELAETRSAVRKERENLIGILKFLKARRANQPYDVHDLRIHFEMGTLRDASWRTASATGALSYMEYPEVQRYAAAYQLQDEFAAVQSRTLEEFLQLDSYGVFEFVPNKMSPMDAEAASTDVQRTIAHLIAMDQLGEGLAKTYRQALAPE